MTRSLVEEAIQEHWGERCTDFEPGCPCCRAWVEYDDIERLLRPCGEAVMTNITIPPEVEEAVADIIAVSEHGMPLHSLTRRTQTRIRRNATAALRAGIAAWPGMWHIKAVDFEGKVILPLPMENTNDQA